MKNNLIENKLSNGKELRKKKRSVQLNNITNNIEINHFDIRPHYIFQNNDIKGNKNKKLNEINLEIKQFQIKENDEEKLPKNVKDLVLLEFDMPAAHKLYVKKYKFQN